MKFLQDTIKGRVYEVNSKHEYNLLKKMGMIVVFEPDPKKETKNLKQA